VAKKTKIDFSGVPKDIRAGGASAHVPEDDYLGKIISAQLQKGKESGARFYNWTIQITQGKYKGKKLRLNTSLKPDALWNLRNLIFAATGKNVAGKAVAFDPEKLYGKVVAFTTQDREYESGSSTRMTSDVVDVRPKEELEQGDDEEEDEEDDEAEEEETDTEEEEDEDLEDVEVDEL
jgi:hypothetical protein